MPRCGLVLRGGGLLLIIWLARCYCLCHGPRNLSHESAARATRIGSARGHRYRMGLRGALALTVGVDIGCETKRIEGQKCDKTKGGLHIFR